MTLPFFAASCRPGRRHRYDPRSGWCTHGCGLREDGRVLTWRGDLVNPGPTYTPAELEQIRQRLTPGS